MDNSNINGSSFDSMMPIFYTTLIIIGVILLFITVGSPTINSTNGTIAGFFLIFFGILIIVIFLGNKKGKTQDSKISFLSKLYSSGPFLIVAAIILYIIILLFKYRDRISHGNVAPGYVSFTNISILLILLQLGIFYTAMQDKNFKETNKLDKVYSMILYFVGILNIVSVVTLYIILAKYATDG